MKPFDYKKVIQWLGHILRCPICGYKYNLEQTQVIDSEHNDVSNNAKILIHSDCSRCKSSVMFNIEINGPEVFSVGVVTDLTGKDSTKFKNARPIGINEIIGMHQNLRGFKGDLIKILTKKE